MKRALISMVLGAGLMIAPVATFAASSPLAPGGAAGVSKAESMGGVPIYAWVGGALVIIGFVAVLGNNGNGHAGVTTCQGPDGTTASCPPNTTSTTGTH